MNGWSCFILQSTARQTIDKIEKDGSPDEPVLRIKSRSLLELEEALLERANRCNKMARSPLEEYGDVIIRDPQPDLPDKIKYRKHKRLSQLREITPDESDSVPVPSKPKSPVRPRTDPNDPLSKYRRQRYTRAQCAAPITKQVKKLLEIDGTPKKFKPTDNISKFTPTREREMFNKCMQYAEDLRKNKVKVLTPHKSESSGIEIMDDPRDEMVLFGENFAPSKLLRSDQHHLEYIKLWANESPKSPSDEYGSISPISDDELPRDEMWYL